MILDNTKGIYNIAETFFQRVYPFIETQELYSSFINTYYLPNKKVLDFLYSKWGAFSDDMLSEMIGAWQRSELSILKSIYDEIDFKSIELLSNRVCKMLGITDVSIYILIGNNQSGLFAYSENGHSHIFIALEVVQKFGNVDQIIKKSLCHELFHVYHHQMMFKSSFKGKGDFTELMLMDGLADYFTHLQFPELSISDLLMFKESEIEDIELQFHEYWKLVMDSIIHDDNSITVAKFMGHAGMWKEFLDFQPTWPQRLSYYFGFKIIEKRVGADLKNLMSLSELSPQQLQELIEEE